VNAVAALSQSSHSDVRPGWWKWAIALTASLGAVMEIIDTSIVNVALTHMQASLGATVSEIGWAVTAYTMANVIIIPLSAWLGEVFGKKNYFIFSLIGFTAASVLCGMATSLPMLIAARILQGLTGGGLLAKAQGILFETFPKKDQGLAQAVFGLSLMVGPALGPVLGGYITDTLNWRWIFFVNIPFGLLAVLAAVIFFIQDKKEGIRLAGHHVDWFGILFLTMGLGSLQILLEEGQRDDWFASPFITTMAISATVGLVLFVWQELTTDHPAVNLRVLRHGSLAAGSVFSMVLGLGIYGAVFVIPIFAQSILQFTATKTGLLLLPSALASATFMFLSSWMAREFDARLVIFGGTLLLVLSLLMMADINPQSTAESLLLPNILRGIGMVFIYLPLTMASLGGVPRKEVHAASGFFNLTRQIGGSIGIAFLTTLLDQRLNYHRSILSEHISRYEPAVRQQLSLLSSGFAARGSDFGQSQALITMNRMLDMQAAVLSYGDIFWVVAIIFILSLLLLIFMKSGHEQDQQDVSTEVH
jgi:DHA2 family multidrug resistance protein